MSKNIRGMGDWGLGPIPNPQSPIPNPQSPFPVFKYISKYLFSFKYPLIYKKILIKKTINNGKEE